MTGLGERLHGQLHQAPGSGLLDDAPREDGVQRVPTAVGHEVPDQRMAHQGEVADDVENLVPDELVLEPQRGVQDARLTQYHRVVERAAERQPLLAEHLDLPQEAEGARRRDLVDKCLFAHPQRAHLMPQQRVIEADAVGHAEMIGGIQGDPLAAARKLDGPHDLHESPRLLQRRNAGFVHQVHERRRAAVHDGHLGLIQLDDDVVDAEADERGEQVLDGLYRRIVLRQTGRVVNARHAVDPRRNFQAAQVEPPEDDAVIGRRRLEAQRPLVPGVKTNP